VNVMQNVLGAVREAEPVRGQRGIGGRHADNIARLIIVLTIAMVRGMKLLTEPFATDFMARALLGGVVVASICAIVGTWVVIRGMAFLGEAIGHGMLPGVALATVMDAPVVLGAAVSAVVMSGSIGTLQRRGRLSYDTTIGLLFVMMLSLGVIIVSHSRSFATDASAMLFGDILAIQSSDIALLACALTVTVGVAAAFHRSFIASAFDPRIAHTLALRPGLAQVVLVGLVTLAVVASYQAVGSLLVIGLLLGPVVGARQWTRRIPSTMVVAAFFGAGAVFSGLLVSWHAGTAAGASIACAAVTLAALSGASRGVVLRASVRRRQHAGAPVVAATSTAALSTSSVGDR
jgi:zinc/manganese transport system permease protein